MECLGDEEKRDVVALSDLDHASQTVIGAGHEDEIPLGTSLPDRGCVRVGAKLLDPLGGVVGCDVLLELGEHEGRDRPGLVGSHRTVRDR